MIQIFSADPHWGIGKDNRLLFHVPGDMAFFRRMTAGKTVIMGRKTLDSLPGGKPLPKRANVVLTRDPDFARAGVQVVHSLPELFEHIRGVAEDDRFVIGGEQVYRLLLPYCDKAYVTRWSRVAQADTFVPDLDALTQWRLAEQSEIQEEEGIAYRFCTYVQDRPQGWTPLDE